MTTYCLRLSPGMDLKRELDDLAEEKQWSAACILTGIGSLSSVAIRYADAGKVENLEGPLEILTLAGTLSRHGSHLHLLVSDANGLPRGGHLKEGSMIRTTAEIVLAILPEWEFTREPDPATGYPELSINHRSERGKPGTSD